MNNHRHNRLLLLAGMTLILAVLPLVVGGCDTPLVPLGSGILPVDVVMADNELYFVLENEHEFSALSVVAVDPNTGERPINEWKPLWFFNDSTNEAKKGNYLWPKQIKYGQTPEGFTCITGPFELQTNVEYSVYISMRPQEASETFIITGDNTVIMPHPRFERQKNRTYSVSIDENGNKVLVSTPKPSTPTSEVQGTISSSKYVFIEHHISVYGEPVEGKYPFMFIDFPLYFFNENTGSLDVNQLNIEINDSLKAVYGDGMELGGCAGSGMSTYAYGVYDLPYERDKLKILEIEGDGTVHLSYNSLSIVLKSGEKWSNVESIIDTKESNGVNTKARLTTTDTIVNYGILDKSKIVTNSAP